MLKENNEILKYIRALFQLNHDQPFQLSQAEIEEMSAFPLTNSDFQKHEDALADQSIFLAMVRNEMYLHIAYENR